jgi:UDP-glucose 4-epimerase
MTRILVTGASGFVGRAVCRRLVEAGYAVRAIHGRRRAPAGTEAWQSDLATVSDWGPMLDDVAAVVHLAGLAHTPVSAVDRAALRTLNVDVTHRLARAVEQTGIHLVFISSAKVLGATGRFTDTSPAAPPDAYAESKWAAEQALTALPGLDYVILRPPLVYGPGVGANFHKLLKLMDASLPLPFASVAAQRSLIGVDNLADAILRCLTSAAPNRRAYLVADNSPLALPDLLRAIAVALQRRAWLFPCPTTALAGLARLSGQAGLVERLLTDLVVDDSEFRIAHGWEAPTSFAEGLAATCAAYRHPVEAIT